MCSAAPAWSRDGAYRRQPSRIMSLVGAKLPPQPPHEHVSATRLQHREWPEETLAQRMMETTSEATPLVSLPVVYRSVLPPAPPALRGECALRGPLVSRLMYPFSVFHCVRRRDARIQGTSA